MRQAPHERDIVYRLVCLPVAVIRKAGRRAADLHVRAGNADRRTDLVIRSSRRKDGERIDERDLPGKGKSCRHGRHILLGDAHLEITLRERRAEQLRHGRISEIRLQNDDILIFFPEAPERLAVRGPAVSVFHKSASFYSAARIAAIHSFARTYSASVRLPL